MLRCGALCSTKSRHYAEYCRQWLLQQRQRSCPAVLMAAAAATTTTMTTTGLLVHHHHYRFHQRDQQRFFFKKKHATASSLKSTSSDSSREDVEGEDADVKKRNDNFIFDIEQWAKKVKRFDYEDSSSQILSHILPKNSNSNITKCEEGGGKSQKSDKSKETQSSFFRQFQNNVTDVFEDWAPSSAIPRNKTTNTTKKKGEGESSFEDMMSSLVGLLTSSSSKSNKNERSTSTSDENATTIAEIVSKARKMSENSGDVSDKSSLLEVFAVCKRAVEILQENDNGEVDDILNRLPMLNPSNLFYFLEYEESVKNPSYRRRKHRFYPGVDTNEVNDLNEKLRLALLSYEDNLENIKTNLENKFDYELVYCTMESLPGQPSHFIAVKNKSKKKKATKKNDESSSSFSSFWSSSLFNDSSNDDDNDDDDSLDMILVVRGTKTITDVITDLLCDATEYRNGYAHAGILESGKYLSNKHDELFQNIIKVSGKKRINLTLVGHSLGAGAASIAGMELNDKDNMNVHVYGFGCPALVSKELSESAANYITTIVADNDLIPRMSTATMMNAIIDVGSFNWIAYARRDIEEAIIELQQRFQPLPLTKTAVDRILSLLDDILPDESSIPSKPAKRMEPILFPPGRIYHFYRDGFAISGNVVPCTFFNELDLSRRMIHDHLLRHGYSLIFLDIMRAQHGDHYFQFEIDKKPVS